MARRGGCLRQPPFQQAAAEYEPSRRPKQEAYNSGEVPSQPKAPVLLVRNDLRAIVTFRGLNHLTFDATHLTHAEANPKGQYCEAQFGHSGIQNECVRSSSGT